MKRMNLPAAMLTSACFVFVMAAFGPLLSGQELSTEAQSGVRNRDDKVVGAVYVASNGIHGNDVLIFRRHADGKLSEGEKVATGGRGTGGLLKNQGAVTLSKGNEWLFVANPGSDDISVFRVIEGGALVLVDRARSGGDRPVSVTVTQDLVYVANAGSSGNITGFRVRHDGKLKQIPSSTRPLSTTAFETCKPPVVDLGDPDAKCSIAGPTTIGFSPDGNVLVVTERLVSHIDTWTLDDDGLATSSGIFQQPTNSTPFGFAFADRGRIVVADSFLDKPPLAAASSFILSDDGTLTAKTVALGNGNASTCWVVISNDGRFAFVTQPVSQSISSYAIEADGNLSLLNPSAAEVPGGDPRDEHLSGNGRFLYALNNRTGTVTSFRVKGDGSLVLLCLTAGRVPSGANGLAAR
ncbi:MAG: lactonase family protein [Bryobacteraceae bacterium]